MIRSRITDVFLLLLFFFARGDQTDPVGLDIGKWFILMEIKNSSILFKWLNKLEGN